MSCKALPKDHNLSYLGGKIKFLREEICHFSLRETADRINETFIAEGDPTRITAGSISKIENRIDRRTSLIVRFATVLGCSPDFLEYNTQKNTINIVSGYTSLDIKNSAWHPILTEFVPIYAWHDVGGNPIDKAMRIPSGSLKSFVLIIEGDSMIATSSGVPSYFPGDRIYIDPIKQVKSHSFVVAKLPGEKNVIFRKFVKESGKSWLVPLNSQFPATPLTSKIKLLGVQYCKIRYCKD